MLSGAGISTESGIPCYRDREGQRTGRASILLKDFLGSDHARRRYWARSLIGWPVVAGAEPNAAHHAVRALAARSRVHRLVTQNVDGLHTRAAVQRMLEAMNPDFVGHAAPDLPDGDANIEHLDFDAFDVPGCTRCGGVLKPDVVFFGESVPRELVQDAARSLDAADAMLVLGSSLMVYSGYRFCEWAAKSGKPIAAVNIGKTRADALLALKVEARCSDVLGELIEQLDARPAVAG
ncbi:NAD-dependent protein deacetylase of SIR2 family [Candidatus Burkholderia verschuerenii]|uniref:protein acetyllysine N-acetyltransferase n=1 Tax=Candidatus Burkholderia verschuerenii TaxID=242163 RepID=A0A0L0M8F4_9BURK|nr:NAD-dependent protein deacetylase of SIR2 family [Candidatus Burkholderia verschuerenii]